MENSKITQSQTLKASILTLMNSQESYCSKYTNLPKPPLGFTLAKANLERPEFNLVVCGKVKHGKSSFINALMGKTLLPVSNDVATSTIFRISHAEKDAFFLIYDNGDKEEISEKDLTSYGSQKTIDSQGLQSSKGNKSIAYIQIYTKLDFVPEGVSIIDTPGIGSDYPLHSRITKEYIKHADAALYILKPSPLETTEIEFLKEVYTITPNILYTTSCIDTTTKDIIEKTESRNNKLLNEHFADKIYRPIEMTRISSKALLEAANSEDEEFRQAYYADSNYEELKTKLLELIFITQGYYKASFAYNEAVGYFNSVAESISSQLEAARSSGAHREELLSKFKVAKQYFDENLSKSRRLELSKKIEDVARLAQGDLSQIFNTSDGDIITSLNEEIDSLSKEDIEAYTQSIGERLNQEIEGAWQKICGYMQTKTIAIVADYERSCQLQITSSRPKAGLMEVTQENQLIHEASRSEKFNEFKSNYFSGGMVAGGAFAVANLVGHAAAYAGAAKVVAAAAIICSAPVAAVVGVGVLVWGTIKGVNMAKQKAVEKSQSNLKNYVRDGVKRAYQHLTKVSLINNQYNSLYQAYAFELRKAAEKSMDETYQQYYQELQALKDALDAGRKDEKVLAALEEQEKMWLSKKEQLLQNKELLSSIL